MHKRVGVTYREAEKVEPYRNALRAVGIEPVLIHPDAPAPLDGLDGLLLTGGPSTRKSQSLSAAAARRERRAR